MTTSDEERWKRYYKHVSGRHPRELMIQAMRRFGDRGQFDGTAVDFGCGPGIEALALLSHGWHVLATDYQAESIERIEAQVPDEHKTRLTTLQASFEEVELPRADFIWAGNSLPFCLEEHLDQVIANVIAALKPGGRFAGDFFGPRHQWASEDHVTPTTEEYVRNAFADLHLEYWLEHEGERDTTLGVQHWHGYGLIYRKV